MDIIEAYKRKIVMLEKLIDFLSRIETLDSETFAAARPIIDQTAETFEIARVTEQGTDLEARLKRQLNQVDELLGKFSDPPKASMAQYLLRVATQWSASSES